VNSRERVLTALKLKEPDRVPWMEMYIHSGMAEKILGKKPLIKTKDSSSGEWGPRISPDIAEFLNIDNLNYNFKPPEYAEVHTGDDGIEFLGKGLITNRDDLNMVKLPDPDDENLYKPLESFIDRYKKDFAMMVNLRLGGVSAYLSMGIDKFSLFLYDDPEFVFTLFDKYVNWIVRAVENIQELDVDILIFSEDMAAKDGPLFSPEMFRKIFLPRYKIIADKIKIPWIYHSDGNYMLLLDDLLSLGMNGIANLEAGCMDLKQLKKDYGDKVCLMGNIDISYTLTKGTVEETAEEVSRKIKEAGPGGGYILASSNGITHYLKKENVLEMNRIVGESFYPL
jgi:uroporphyrinogen decarboxylase